MSLIVWLLLGLIAGWLASIIMGTNSSQGPVTDIILGVLGAFVGGFIASMLGLGGASGLDIYSIVIATFGAVALTWLSRLFRRSSL